MKPYTVDAASAAILAKLVRGGGKGIGSPLTPKTPVAKRAALEEALAALEAESALFVDRRGPKPRFYAWDSRPALPTVESVAARLLSLAEADFPAVATRARWKAALKKEREAAGLLEPALAELLRAGRLERFLYRKPRQDEEVFLPARNGPPPGALDADAVRAAYAHLVARTGFPAVAISLLRAESGAPLPELQEWLRAEQRLGRAILSRGDWSLADEAKRQAAVEWQGEPHLLVRILP